jgi:3-oxoacyl-(acyl-carrier-protein) synthase
MSIAEGAGMLLLEAADKPGEGIEILGAGLSCDAHHPVQPHPEGLGALSAMRAALSQAELGIEEIDYINLHGTGTPENDRSEAAAVNILFDGVPPPVSSVKGATGHSLAASGAIEAVIAALCIEREIIPANTGCRVPDTALKLPPVARPIRKSIRTVLSNSFGFGGNNASVIIGRRHDRAKTALGKPAEAHPFRAASWSAITGAGLTDEALQTFLQGRSCKGRIDSRKLCRGLPAGMIRRIKRLSQMGLALLADMKIPGGAPGPKSIFFGTGWGSLSETHDFLQGLFDSGERFSSPTDFIGSVHNAPSGQIALAAQSTGANVTLSGGDHSFEQALFSAQMLVTDSDPVMVLGADETHDRLSLLFDLSAAADPVLSDGGGALILRRTPDPVGPTVTLKYFETDFENRPDPQELVLQLGGAERICSKYRLIMAGLPAAERAECRRQLDRFMALSGFKGGILDYRSLTGEFATSAAVAVVFAVSMVHSGLIPLPFRNGAGGDPQAGSVLLLGLGSALTAIEVGPQ